MTEACYLLTYLTTLEASCLTLDDFLANLVASNICVLFCFFVFVLFFIVEFVLQCEFTLFVDVGD